MTSKFAGQQYELNAVHYLRKKIAWADGNTVTTSLGWIPEGANVIRGGVHVQEVFNAGTNNNLSIGFRNAPGSESDDSTAYASTISLAAVGVIVADDMATTGAIDLTLGAEITCLVELTSTQATTGAAIVWVEFIVDNDGDVSGA